MHEHSPVRNQYIAKNKPATASLVLSLISVFALGLILPFFIIGAVFLSMAGQSPQASGFDTDNPAAMEEYFRESRNLRTSALVLFALPPATSWLLGIIGLVFGIIGVRNPNRKGQAIAGIVISSIMNFVGIVIFLIVLLI